MMADRLTNPLRKAGLTDGVVTVILNADPEYDQAFMADWPYLQEGAGIGSTYDAATDTFGPPVPVEPESEPVPEFVSRLQGRIALYRMGMLDAVEALTQAAGGEILLAWQDAGDFYRDSILINGLAPHLGWGDANIDDLFRLAKSIRV